MSKIAMHRWTLHLVALVLIAGCGEAPSTWPVSFDLAAGLAVADKWSETRSLDLATPRGRRHLISGWSEDRWDRRRHRGFVANRGRVSVLDFYVGEARPMTLRFLAGSEDEDAATPVAVEVLVNGYPVDTLFLEGRPRRHRVRVPESLLRTGDNELTLRGPAPEEGTGSSVRWYQLEMQYADDSEPPRPFLAGEGDGLMIPYGTRLEYTLKLPAESLLTIERLQFVGEAGGRLTLVLEEDGQEATEFSLPAEAAEDVAIPLSAGFARISRLTLRADRPDAAASGRSGVLLTRPVVRSPRVTPEASQVESDIPASSSSPATDMPNILLYVVDTLRADHLGLYGYDKPVSPALDRFAARATVFDNAVAQSSWTRAAMASIFTGLWPLKHATNGRKDILDSGATTLAEVLSEAGYLTAAKVRNWNVFPVFGFRQGFQDFRRVREGKADHVNRLVEGWLSSRPADRPFFLWVHTVDPHEPYRPPEQTRENFFEEGQKRFDLDKHPGFKLTREMSERQRQEVVRYLISLYDAEIAFNDRAFGELVAMLESLALLDSTVVVFVSDHGEEFLDHGTWGHGRNLYAENLNVPLVIRFPDRGHGKRVEAMVQQIDLMPTLLDYIGLPVPPGVEGRSFLPLLADGTVLESRESPPAFSFLHLDGAAYRSLVDGEWKLIQRLSDAGEVSQTALFHRQSDPEEGENRILEMPIRGRFMELLLDAKMAEGSVLMTEEAVLDEETEKALKALGYLQ
jgi:arylsulfatase A-like enzyme